MIAECIHLQRSKVMYRRYLFPAAGYEEGVIQLTSKKFSSYSFHNL
jgi:hypothetical protein